MSAGIIVINTVLLVGLFWFISSLLRKVESSKLEALRKELESDSKKQEVRVRDAVQKVVTSTDSPSASSKLRSGRF